MSATVASGTNRKYLVAVVGTLGLAVGAGVTFQFGRPSSGFADQPGKATVSDQTRSESGAAKNYLARVGGKLISYDEVAQECVNQHGKEILENLINRKIIEQACEKQGIEVSAEEVNAEIVKIAKRFNLSVEQWLSMLQAERNTSPMQYKQDIIWPMLALRKLAGGDIKLTKKDLEEAYTRNYGPRVKARIMVLENQRVAAQIWEKCRQNPEEFEQLVYKHSVDPASRPLGGSVPPIRRFAGHPEVEKAAFALKEGEISGVLQIDVNQWVILKCEGQTEQLVKSMEDVLPILKDELQEEKVQASVAEVFKKIKAEARVDNYLTGVSTGTPKKGVTRPEINQTGAVSQPAARVTPAVGAPMTGVQTRTGTPRAPAKTK